MIICPPFVREFRRPQAAAGATLRWSSASARAGTPVGVNTAAFTVGVRRLGSASSSVAWRGVCAGAEVHQVPAGWSGQFADGVHYGHGDVAGLGEGSGLRAVRWIDEDLGAECAVVEDE